MDEFFKTDASPASTPPPPQPDQSNDFFAAGTFYASFAHRCSRIYVEEGFRVIFREGRTRGLGSITKVSFDGDKQKSWPDSRKQLHGTNMEAMMNTATATKSAG